MAEPMKEGTRTSAGIETSMNSANINKKSQGKEYKYDKAPAAKGGSSIFGPGTKNSMKKL